MKLSNLGKTIGAGLHTVAAGAKHHAPEIGIAFGLAAGVSAIVMAVRATPKATKLIEEKKAELEVEKLPVKETVKTAWKCYLPSAALGILSATMIISGSKISINRTAAMGALYTVSRDAFEDYKASVKEEADAETVERIEKKSAEKTADRAIQKNDISSPQLLVSGGDEELFIDSLSGRMFKSSVNRINAAVNDYNEQLLGCDSLSLNDFYYYIGLDENEVGDMLGWHIYITGQLKVSYTATMHDGRPVAVLNYDTPPRYYEEF